MDDVVQKATELGVDVVIPAITARTIIRLDRTKQLIRQKRWQKIAREASKQCARSTFPVVRDPMSWRSVLSCIETQDLKLMFCLNDKTKNLKSILSKQKKISGLTVFIGPEGDFTPEEVRQTKEKGAVCVSLGNNILKTDTAAICALSVINYELDL